MSDIAQERRRKFPPRWADGRMIQMFHSLYSWGDFFPIQRAKQNSWFWITLILSLKNNDYRWCSVRCVYSVVWSLHMAWFSNSFLSDECNECNDDLLQRWILICSYVFFSIYLLYGVFTTLKKCIFHFLNQAQPVSERREEPSKLKKRPWQRKVSIGRMWNCDGGRHDDGEEVSIDIMSSIFKYLRNSINFQQNPVMDVMLMMMMMMIVMVMVMIWCFIWKWWFSGRWYRRKVHSFVIV